MSLLTGMNREGIGVQAAFSYRWPSQPAPQPDFHLHTAVLVEYASLEFITRQQRQHVTAVFGHRNRVLPLR
ncbi:MAG: hypothetical protein BMS9Abin30_1302 [Gammaproteobacteria bacterium]|nr:MAG: hypothetical protein BMS9Abin30_1302 [Gammaproteobacteria bacterium]